jgi:hypothetical protein
VVIPRVTAIVRASRLVVNVWGKKAGQITAKQAAEAGFSPLTKPGRNPKLIQIQMLE